MNIVDKLEDTLNGGYGGLYGEVVTCDMYHLRSVKFQPDVIFDIGANVGIFSRFARSLFPKARIIAVEPDPTNCIHFRKFTKDSNTILIEMALGHGQIYHGTTAVNGSGETYLSAGLGYPAKELNRAASKHEGIEFSPVPTIMLDALESFCDPGQKTLMKIDCEGAENFIWAHAPSMRALARMGFLAIEVHDYGINLEETARVKSETAAALRRLELSHVCERDGVYFWATKRI